MPDTVPHAIFAAAERYGSKIAVVDTEADRRISFIELVAEARGFARALIAARHRPGEAVGLWAPNGARWIVAAIGSLCAGGVLVPLNTRLRGREVADIVDRAEVRLLVCAGDFLGQDYPAMLNGRATPRLRQVIATAPHGGASERPVSDWAEFIAGATNASEGELEARLAELTPQSIADMMFTSGTTGLPKGAVFTHEKTLLAGRMFAEVTGLSGEDRVLPFGPFSHTASYKGGWLASILTGATIYARNLADAVSTMRLVSDERITFMPCPPTVLQTILADPQRAAFDLSSLRFVSTGGTMVPLDLVRRVRDELGVDHVATGYGLTECEGTATFTRADDPLEIIAETAGRAAPGVEVKCVRTDGSVAEIGEAGEVFIRTAKNMVGYLNDPQATAEALTADGWLRTGDLGRLDAAGNLTITDRLKDMYIVGGFNCYPAEIERVLSTLPGVLHCAVVGAPDERLGEVGRAFVVRAPGTSLSEAEILAWCRENFANYKAPRSVRFVDALPTNASGKVMKQLLRTADGV